MKTRSIKDLLIILRDNLEPMFKKSKHNGGICSVMYSCESYGLITSRECRVINDYLYVNKPEEAIKREVRYAGKSDKTGFCLDVHWWTPRHSKPRIKWLNEQIEKL